MLERHIYKNWLLYLILLMIFLLALGNADYSKFYLGEIFPGQSDGRMSLSCNDNYCTAEIIKFWNNKAVAYYWRSSSEITVTSYVSNEKQLPKVNPTDYDISDNQITLRWGSCTKKAWNVRWGRVEDALGNYQYVLYFNVGNLNENSGCITDIQGNAGSFVEGYTVFVKKIAKPECSTNLDCHSTEVCKNGKCITLECEKGYKAENHECVLGEECHNDSECYWCVNSCEPTLLKDKLACVSFGKMIHEGIECRCVSNKCTEVEKPKICNKSDIMNKVCIDNKTLQLDVCNIYSWETKTYECPDPTIKIENGEAIGYCDSDVNNCRIKIHCNNGYSYNTKTGKCESTMFPLYILFGIIIAIIAFIIYIWRGEKTHRF